MNQSFLKQCTLLVLAATFLVPLVVIPTQFIFPFIVPKILLFRSLAFVSLGGYLLLLLGDWDRYRPKGSAIAYAVGLFLLSFSISTIVGVDWYRSLWDTHERMLGLFTLLHYGLYFFVLAHVVETKKEWTMLLRFFLLAGTVVMGIGIMQRFVDPELLLNRGGTRVSATLGNPIYYSAYGLFLLAIGGLLLLDEKKKTFWWWAAVVGMTSGFMGIFLGGTRGTALGLFGAVAVGTLCILAVHWKNPVLRARVLGGIGGAIVILGLLIGFRSHPVVQSLPAVGRIAATDFTDLTYNTRVMAWGVAVTAWKEAPVFGWGPNNFYFAFNKHYRPEFLRHGLGETWFDNAHSAVFNTLAVQGIIGIIAYFGLFIVPMFVLYGAYKREQISAGHATIALCFLTGHFIHNALVFENPTSYLYFFFFLAYLYGMTKKTESSGKKSSVRPISAPTAALTMIVVLLFVYATNINPARANSAALDMILTLGRTPAASINALEKTLAIPTPHIDDIRNDFARNAGIVIPNLFQEGQGELAMSLLSQGKDLLRTDIALHPLDVRYHLALGQLLSQEALFTERPEAYVEATVILEEALKESPRRQQLQYTLSLYYAQIGNFDRAISLAMDALDGDRTIGESWARLISLYLQKGDTTTALEYVTEARAANINFKEFEPFIAQFEQDVVSSTVEE